MLKWAKILESVKSHWLKLLSTVILLATLIVIPSHVYGADLGVTTLDETGMTVDRNGTVIGKLNCELTGLGANKSVVVYFEYGSTTSYGSNTSGRAAKKAGGYSINAPLLTWGTYHYRAVVNGGGLVVNGADNQFTLIPPTVSTSAASGININRSGVYASLNGNITSMGSCSQVYGYFEYGLSTDYGFNSYNKNYRYSDNGTFTQVVGGLLPGFIYHYRSVLKTGSNYVYGSDRTFGYDADLTGGSGSGDMLQAEYDDDADGVVNSADNATYAITAGSAASSTNSSLLNSQTAAYYLDASHLAAGYVPTARLGSGTANNGTVLYGDNVWREPPTGGDGYGDMSKAVYDIDADNLTDTAEVANSLTSGYLTGSTFPVSPQTGQSFLHVTTGRKILYHYNGSIWVATQSLIAPTFYVNASTGTDNQSYGYDADHPFATWVYAFNFIPPTCNTAGGDTKIYLAAGTYTAVASRNKMLNDSLLVYGAMTPVTGGTTVTGTGGHKGDSSNRPQVSGSFSAGDITNFTHKVLHWKTGSNILGNEYDYRVINMVTSTTIYLEGNPLPNTPANGDTFEVLDWLTTVNTKFDGSFQEKLNFYGIKTHQAYAFRGDVVLNYCWIYNDTFDAGLYADNAYIHAHHCFIQNPVTGSYFGANASWAGNLDLEGCLVYGYSKTQGTGIIVGSNGSLNLNTCTIQNCNIGIDVTAGGYAQLFTWGIQNRIHGCTTGIRTVPNCTVDYYNSTYVSNGTKMDGTSDSNTANTGMDYTAHTMLPTAVTPTKLLISSKNIADASGSTAYTGVGFKPSAIVVLYADSSHAATWQGVGVSDASAAEANIWQAWDGHSDDATWLVCIQTGASDYTYATVTSYDTDGFTLSWVKNGSPTGTTSLLFLCFR